MTKHWLQALTLSSKSTYGQDSGNGSAVYSKKEGDGMEWFNNMNKALEYIEEHITQDLRLEEIAKTACSSSFHFQRLFHMITGLTVTEYIRKRRLTMSAQEITVNGCKVIDTAYKYGYESPESFAKAFRKMHSISPTAARSSGAKLKAFPKISFHISIKGEKDMDYRIVDRKEFLVAGVLRRITTKDGENFNLVPEFWQDSFKDGSYEKVAAMGGGVYGICMDYNEQSGDFNYIIATDNPAKVLPEGFVERKIPAATWAVFDAVGPLPGAVQDVTKRIYSEWFPATGYEHVDAPEFEFYPPGDTSAEDYRCEIWMPVKKKQD